MLISAHLMDQGSTHLLDSDESISHEAAAFYGELRGLVVVFLFVVTLLTIAHLTLQHFASSTSSTLLNYGRTDQLVHQFVRGVCTFTLTISLIGFSLLPFSIIANEILICFKHSYYVQWLDTGLVKDLALIVNFGTKSLCVLLPFSFFLLISQGFSNSSQQTFGSRLLEASYLLLFSHILIFGTIWSFGLFLSALHSTIVGQRELFSRNSSFLTVHPIAALLYAARTLSWSEFITRFLFHLLLRMLDSVQLVASLFGLILMFACTPFGLLHVGLFLLKRAIRTLPQYQTQTDTTYQLYELNMTALCVKDNQQTTELIYRDGGSKFYSPLLLFCASKKKAEDIMQESFHFNDHFALIRAEYERVQHRKTYKFSSLVQECLKPLVPCIILLIITGLLHLVHSFVLINMVQLLRNLLFGPSSSQASDMQALAPLVDQLSTEVGKPFSLGDHSTSAFGLVGAFLQICVIYFILFLGLCGFYATPAARMLRPKSHSLRLESLLFNVLLLLLFSSALPLQSNLLGLTTLTVPNVLGSRYSVQTCIADTVDFHCGGSEMPTSTCHSHFNISDNSSDQAGDCEYSLPPASSPASSDKEPNQFWSFWHTVLPFSFYHSSSHFHFISDSDEPTFQSFRTSFSTESKSIWSQFVSRAFGVSTPSSASYGLILIILLYNLCFIVTSVWIAGRRLSDATRSFSLEFVTCLRCLQVQVSYLESFNRGSTGTTSSTTASVHPIAKDAQSISSIPYLSTEE